jgi:acyl-homoserine lactone synthase
MVRIIEEHDIRGAASAGAGGHEASDTERLLASMFEDRKRLFVDLLGWNVRTILARYEIDDFDKAGAVYVIAEDEGGLHEGSLRLLPSTRPHILGSLFDRLCAGGVPTGPQIFEITRLCLPQRLGAERRLDVRNRLISAMVDYSLERSISLLTGVVEDRFRKEILAMGWRAEPLGPAIAMEGATLGAFCAHIDLETPDRLRWTGIYGGTSGQDIAA